MILAVVEKEFRMFFRYPLRVISSILVGIVFLLQFVYFGQAVLGGAGTRHCWRPPRGWATIQRTPS